MSIVVGSARDSWAALPFGAQVALEQQWQGVATRALPCGSAVTDAAGEVIASGRNRAYDEPGGADALQGTRIAHAELNAMAEVATTLDWVGLTLWSTQHPCAMCAAAAAFTGIGRVVYLADDPSDDSSPGLMASSRRGIPYESMGSSDWATVSTLLFLTTGAYLHGHRDSTIARAEGGGMGGAAGLALDLAAEDHLGRLSRAGYPLPDALEPLWPRITSLSTGNYKRGNQR